MYNDKLHIIIEDASNSYLGIRKFSSADNANLPYNSGTKMLTEWLKHINCFESMTLMFQKEVADRILAKPGSKTMALISYS